MASSLFNPTLLAKNNRLVLNIGVRHSDFLEVGTKIDIHNNGLLGKSKIEHFYRGDYFYLDVGRIICNFHFSIVPIGTLGVNISS